MNNQEAIKSMRNLDDVISITVSEHESVKLAIEALEKQIPKKLKYYAETEEDFAHVKCPNCKNVLETVPLFIKNNYCDECGQKLDWSVEK